MNSEIMFFIGVILGGFIVLFEIVKLIKLDRIEKKYVKTVKVIRSSSMVDSTIKQYELRGWLVGNVNDVKGHAGFYEITFIK